MWVYAGSETLVIATVQQRSQIMPGFQTFSDCPDPVLGVDNSNLSLDNEISRRSLQEKLVSKV